MPEIPLYLFAKAPVAGKAKKRMCPPLDENQAASVAAALLAHASSLLESSWPGRCVLSVTPDLGHPVFKSMAQSRRWQTIIQPKADLGDRMHHALLDGIKRTGCAAVVGSDIPGLSRDILHQAHSLLAAGQQVIGPSKDGGFYLLGLNTLPDMIFNHIEWGSAEVYAQLTKNAMACDMSLTCLPALSDCDYFEDLRNAASNIPVFSKALSHAGFDISLLEALSHH